MNSIFDKAVAQMEMRLPKWKCGCPNGNAVAQMEMRLPKKINKQ
jgi:hypothetical protein